MALAKSLRCLDLFSGIGGIALGFEAAGIQTQAFCEINPYCQAVLNKNFPGVPIFEDITKLTGREKEIQGVDIIAGGFPCQDISIAGKKAGLAGKQSGLWRDYVRIVRVVKPRFVFIENVARLRVDGLQQILYDLWCCGYNASWQTVPAWIVGCPQARRRIFIVAHRTKQKFTRWRTRIGGRCRWVEEIGYQSRVGPSSSNVQLWTEPKLARVVYGVPKTVDRFAALGNAVVPQIAYLFGKVIVEMEKLLCQAP